MAYEIMNKEKVNTESDNSETARDKGVNSTDWLGVFLEIENKIIGCGKCIREDSTMRCWQYELVQVCEIKDSGELFILFGMALNISKRDSKLFFHAGNKKGLEAVMGYLSLLNIHPEP